MKARATEPFFDIKEQKYRKTGEVFEVDIQRFEKLKNMELVQTADKAKKQNENNKAL